MTLGSPGPMAETARQQTVHRRPRRLLAQLRRCLQSTRSQKARARNSLHGAQLLNPDPFIGMALAAHETSRIGLGTGVVIPSNRIAPVTANGLASPPPR